MAAKRGKKNRSHPIHQHASARGNKAPIGKLTQLSPQQWRLARAGNMHVECLLFVSKHLLNELDPMVFQQAANVATLPGIVSASYVMPDAHSGYGFPIGGVAAFDANQGGVISAGGVGFDIACGVRTLTTGLHVDEIMEQQTQLADALYAAIPAGVGKGGDVLLKGAAMDDMLYNGAKWAVNAGYGTRADLERTEEQGRMHGADPDMVSDRAKQRQAPQTGTLGSGNHYLEVQEIRKIHDEKIANAYGLRVNDVVISIHCGSRGLGHQIGTDYLQRMLKQAPKHDLQLPDKELACAPIHSALGQEYLGAMRAGINCALANRQVLTHLTRQAIAPLYAHANIRLLYDVSHNTCKEEEHLINNKNKRLFVHRKGATRALGPNHPALPQDLRPHGQPVLIGGSMGTPSYILAGLGAGAPGAFSSANHGAGRALSRAQAKKHFKGRDTIHSLDAKGILIRAASFRGVAEEAPGAYKDVNEVVRVAEEAGLAKVVAELRPVICVKG